MDQVQQVKSWLKGRQCICAPDDWLEACLEWLLAENQGAPLTGNQLYSAVYEQWLLSDLRDIEACCLPEGLSAQQKQNLTGNYCLQVDSVMDVSVAFYTQLQKVKGTENANVHVGAATQATQSRGDKNNRMIMMKMTDGTQDIQGMEYQSIPSLSVNLIPGTKVLIRGPVLCRQGVMMLSSNNVKVLGGEVEALMEENTQEKLLTRKLGQNEHLIENDRQEHRTQFQMPANATSRPIAPRPADATSRPMVPRPADATSRPMAPRPASKPEYIPMEPMDIPDDDFLDSIDTAQLDAMESQAWDDEVDDNLLVEELAIQEQAVLNMEPPQPHNQPHSSHTNPGQVQTETLQLRSPSLSVHANAGQNSSIQSADTSSRVQPKHISEQRRTGERTVQLSNVPEKTQQGSLDHYFQRHAHVQSGVVTGPCTSTQIYSDKNEKTGKSYEPEYFVDLTEDFGGDSPGMSCIQESNRTVSELTSPVCASVNNDPDRGTSRKPHQSNISRAGEASRSQSSISSGTRLTNTATKQTYINIQPIVKKPDIGLDTPPYTYLSTVLSSKLPVNPMIVRVKAFISTLVSKLEHNDGAGWTLIARINDGTAAIDVVLGDQMLTDLIGFSAKDSMQMRVEARTNKAMRQHLANGIRQCQQSLVNLSSILELEVSASQAQPYVRGHFQITEKDFISLKDRVDKFS